MSIDLEADARGLIVRTPYDSQFVSELKRLVPQAERFFTGKPENVWIVDPRHAEAMRRLILTVFKTAVSLPVISKANDSLNGVQIRVEYMGACKARPDGSVSATGHDGQGWNVITPESVLKSFFGQDTEIHVDGVENAPQVKSATFYGALLVSQTATFDEIKSAYKRMARLTHPDVNHEPDAAEQFKAVKRAFDVLGDATTRRRYDAGLALEASLVRSRHNMSRSEWMDLASDRPFRAPLRCGLLTIDGERKLGRVHVSRILAWDDIQNDKGQVMVSSWSMEKQTYEIQWA